MTEDRTLELHTNASHGALEYLRLARDSLACIHGSDAINEAATQIAVVMITIGNFHTRTARKVRHQLETNHADQGS